MFRVELALGKSCGAPLAAAATLTAAGIVMSNPAQAYQLSGCKYAGTNPTIHIVRQGVTGD